MSETVLRARQLTKRYNRHLALDRIDLTVRKGSIYGFIGQNGAGKSTLMRIAAGLAHPTSGSVELFGASEGAKLVTARRRIGTTIETPALFPHLSATENLEIYRLQQGIRNRSRIRETLSLVGLADTGSKKSAEFSMGMKQRLGLAIALMSEPDMLILDEPTNGLDPLGVVELRELLRGLNRETGLTILISSHILSELDQMATDYGFIHQGRMLEQLSASELQTKCRQYLHIKVDNPELALSVIRKGLLSAEYELEPDGSIRLYGGFKRAGSVSSLLFSAGLEIEQFTPVGEQLERYFSRLIGGAAYA
ncbi:ATP-binding cassette domain-containing protein [Cohnella nanjingensis]|uniref:ATP-binding cassette domain-containing protein n=1 Tax=Cohnella nanjingensis TaxID=1387779 RepID=A0A7X0RS05_9BACL|nr:ATP-binding cassette domain-containing protein [Cohnella nanjingensis]MBB6672485.1 ATP-binding cassette domain-containing protein [Cohnella nanjingensis]